MAFAFKRFFMLSSRRLIPTLAGIGAVLALVSGAPGLHAQGEPPRPPNTYYGVVTDQGNNNVLPGGTVRAVILPEPGPEDALTSGVACGAGETLEHEGLSVYVLDVWDETQLAGCGDADGAQVLFTYMPDGDWPALLRAAGAETLAWDRLDSVHEVDLSAASNDLFEGWNRLRWLGDPIPVKALIAPTVTATIRAGETSPWQSFARFSPGETLWRQYFVSAPLDSFNTLEGIGLGLDYWVFVTGDAEARFSISTP
jgi:hypothetical protein